MNLNAKVSYIARDKFPSHFRVAFDICGIVVESNSIHTLPDLSKKLSIPIKELVKVVFINQTLGSLPLTYIDGEFYPTNLEETEIYYEHTKHIGAWFPILTRDNSETYIKLPNGTEKDVIFHVK